MKKGILILLSASMIVLPSCLSRNKRVAESAGSTENVTAVPEDNIILVKGKLVIGHEVRMFSSLEARTEYWITDKSGELRDKYYEIAGPDVAPYTPVYAELKVKDLGKSDDGFAADYAGVYEVVEIVKMAPWEE